MREFGITLIIIFLCLTGLYFFVLKPDDYSENDLYEEIIKRDKIIIGVNADSKPYGFKDKNDKFQGYDVELGRYIAEYLLSDKTKAEFIPVTHSNRIIKAITGEVDIVIATLTITPQREELISFSVPYDTAGQALLIQSKSQITSIADLAGQNIGVVWGTTAEKNLLNLLPNASIVGFKTYNEAYYALKDGYINAITSDDTILNRFALEDSEVKLLPKRYSKEPYGIGFKKGKSTKKLKIKIDHALNDMKQKGIILNLHKKWLG